MGKDAYRTYSRGMCKDSVHSIVHHICIVRFSERAILSFLKIFFYNTLQLLSSSQIGNARSRYEEQASPNGHMTRAVVCPAGASSTVSNTWNKPTEPVPSAVA